MTDLLILMHKDQALGALDVVLPKLGLTPTIVQFDETMPENLPAHPRAVIIMGGSQGVYEHKPEIEAELRWLEEYLQQPDHGPVFGICLGCQMLAHLWGAEVFKGSQGLEFGYQPLELLEADAVFGDELTGQRVMHYHTDTFTRPAGAVRLAADDLYPQQAFRFAERVYGVQFHPEVDAAILARWLAEAEQRNLLPEPAAASATQQQLAHAHMAANHLWLEAFLGRLLRR